MTHTRSFLLPKQHLDASKWPSKADMEAVHTHLSADTGDQCEYCGRVDGHNEVCVMSEVLRLRSQVSVAGGGEPTPQQIDAALNAWFKSPPSETDQGLERSMKAALVAASLTLAEPQAVSVWKLDDDYRALLEALDHTLTVHGHIDAHTPLHERLQRTLALPRPQNKGDQ